MTNGDIAKWVDVATTLFAAANLCEKTAMSALGPVDLSNPCGHVSQVKIRSIHRPEKGCVDCLAIGGEWVHLRVCLICGHVACCDSSPNQHASKHARKTSHAIIASAEVGETWAYCYPDDAMLS
jgi:hypothetical protein